MINTEYLSCTSSCGTDAVASSLSVLSRLGMLPRSTRPDVKIPDPTVEAVPDLRKVANATIIQMKYLFIAATDNTVYRHEGQENTSVIARQSGGNSLL